MKRDYTIPLLIFIALLAILSNLPECYSSIDPRVAPTNVISTPVSDSTHQCIDLTHNLCDSNCECDRLGCDTSLVHIKIPHVFIKQLNVTSDNLISVMYVSSDGEEYAYDNMTQAQFQDVFGFLISTEE